MEPRQPPILLPPAVTGILARLNACGYAAYAVGGCVRDSLRGEPPHDWDIAASSLPRETMACFPGARFVDVGARHGTVALLTEDGGCYEITTFRADGAYTDGRHPDGVTFLSDIHGDLARRDFTVNAMAYHPETGLIDPFGGAEDIRLGRIRCVGKADERFQEDALRILRALRFAARFGYAIEAETDRSLRAGRARLLGVAAERIRVELDGILLGGGCDAVLTGYPEVLGVFLPEILPCVGFQQHNPHHLYDVWTHTARAVAAAERDRDVRLALLLHDLGKPLVFTVGDDGRGHFYGHPEKSLFIARAVLARLRYDGKTTDSVCALVQYHDADIFDTEKSARRWLCRLCAPLTEKLIEVKRADARAQAMPETKLPLFDAFARRVQAALAAGDCVSLSQLAVNGRDILALCAPAGKSEGEGEGKGKWVGDTLRALLSRVVDGALPNERGALLKAAETLLHPRG